MTRLAVIGGSGLYRSRILREPEQRSVITPYGQATMTTGNLKGHELTFLARHGTDHSLAPHLVNYRANIWALSCTGNERVLATAAVGSLNPDMLPGHFVILDQFIDFTRARPGSFFEGPGVRHVDVTQPYCPALSLAVRDAGQARGLTIHHGGTYICTEGPRFETPAEIRMFRSWGADVVGMTNVPEVVLAREMGLCYATVAVVTNMAAGLAGQALSHDEVVEVMDESREHLEDLLETVVGNLPRIGSCQCPGPPSPVGGEE